MQSLANIISSTLVQCRDAFMYSDRIPAGTGKWPVRSRHGQGKLNPFFVLGHPRSGTTLLRALLSSHSQVFIPPENGGLSKMVRVFGSLRGQSWERVVNGVLHEFIGGYEFDIWNLKPEDLIKDALNLPSPQRTLADLISLPYQKYGMVYAAEKHIWGDKTTPGSFAYLSKLNRVFPKSAYVHIVRDGRDCVASSVKAGFFDANYRVAAQAWTNNMGTCRKFGRRRNVRQSYLEIRYEDLIKEPANILASICNLFGIKFEASMLQHHDGVETRLPDIAARAHHANVARPIFSGSRGKWQEKIPLEQQALVSRITRAELTHYGYK